MADYHVVRICNISDGIDEPKTIADVQVPYNHRASETLLFVTSKGLATLTDDGEFLTVYEYDSTEIGTLGDTFKFFSRKDADYTIESVTTDRYYPGTLITTLTREHENPYKLYIYEESHTPAGRYKFTITDGSYIPSFKEDVFYGHAGSSENPATEVAYNINFTSQDQEFSSIKFKVSLNGSNVELCYDDTGVAMWFGASCKVTWSNPAWQTITITDRNQTVESEFATWLFAHLENISSYVALNIYSNDGSTLLHGDPRFTFDDEIRNFEVLENGIRYPDTNEIFKFPDNSVISGLTFPDSGTQVIENIGDLVNIVGIDSDYYIVDAGYSPFYMIGSATLSNIADAIRSKTGRTAGIKVENFAEEIESIVIDGVSETDLDSMLGEVLS